MNKRKRIKSLEARVAELEIQFQRTVSEMTEYIESQWRGSIYAATKDTLRKFDFMPIDKEEDK